LVIEAGYEDYLKEQFPNYRAREETSSSSQLRLQFESVENFLTQLALKTTVEAEASGPNRDQEAVRLSTIHQAKGLEFDVSSSYAL